MKILRGLRIGFAVLICFLFRLVIQSISWLQFQWSELAFSTVLYQLSSPLKGTGTEVIISYLNESLYLALLDTTLVVLCFIAYWRMSPRFFRSLRPWKDNADITRVRTGIANVSVLFLFLAMGYHIWVQAESIGVFSYFEQINSRSTIFEEDYRDPDKVDITFPEKKRNLILIYLESMETTYAAKAAGGGKAENYIPELTDLAMKNLFFSDDSDLGGTSSASGTEWTIAALLGSQSGIPFKMLIERNTAGEYESFLPGVTTFGDILSENGYNNYFMCGSDIAFGGRKDFFRLHGSYTLYDLNTAREEGIVSRYYYNEFWGMEDKYLFTYAKEKLTEIASAEEPFNFTMLTVDTHHTYGYVCDLCQKEYKDTFANVVACSSRQTAAFVEWIQGQAWYEDTTIVIIGDHQSMISEGTGFWDDIGEYERKLYNCFLNLPEGLSTSNSKNRTFTVLDLFPSVLAAMDVKIEGNQLGLGVNLFSEEKTVPERMGLDEFNQELSFYSDYYHNQFIIGEAEER